VLTRRGAGAASPRVPGRTVTLSRVALLAVALLLVVVSYYPFAWDPPRMVTNRVTRGADGSLQFGEMNYARTAGTPAWLQEVRRSGSIQIQLQADPQSLQVASMMMLASNFWTTDFAIGQNSSGLLVWLRRPGSDANGDPPFAVGAVLRPRRWMSVDVTLQRNRFRIYVNGKTRMAARLPADSPKVWGPGQIALGDEVHGGRPWQGKIRLAEVRTPGYAVDYVRPGTLSIPARYFFLPDHIEPFPPANPEQWAIVFLDMLSFVPVGFLIVCARKPPARPLSAALLSAAFAVLIAAGKFLFNARHTSVAIVVMEMVGGLLGALLAAWLARPERRAAGRAVPDRNAR
jgi:Concanavalin A-like lectin/glucanases superfamily